MKESSLTVFFTIVASMAFSQGAMKVEPFLAIEGGSFPDKITLGNYLYEGAEAATIDFSIITKSQFQNGTRPNSTGLYLSTGAVIEYPVTKRLSFRAGIAYANRHFTAKQIGYCNECTAAPIETIFRLSYVDIPLAARYYVVAKRITLFGDAGLTTSPRVHNETVVRQVSYRKDNRHITDAPTHEVMLMAQFGMGAGIRFNKGGINLTTLYRNGITKFAATDNYRFKSFGATLSFTRIIGEVD